MNSGCTRKKAPHIKEIPHFPVAILSRSKWTTALAKNAAKQASQTPTPPRARGAKQHL